jgi:hypothetical protein
MTNTTYRSLRSRSFATVSLLLALVAAARTARAGDEKAAPAAAAETRAAPERHGSAYVDPLGFLLFGPRVGVDAGTKHLTGGIYGRWFSPGLLGQSLFLDEGSTFAFSYGVGTRVRYYLGEGQRGFHFGAGAEYLRTRAEDAAARIASISGYLVPQAEAGYRLAFDRFYAGAAAVVGYAARLSGTVENLPGGNNAGSYMVNDESSVYASAALELGVFF